MTIDKTWACRWYRQAQARSTARSDGPWWVEPVIRVRTRKGVFRT
jgi:hypothetical protein